MNITMTKLHCPPRIIPVLSLSTGHLSEETTRMLDNTPLNRWPTSGGRTEFGYYIHIPEDLDQSLPHDIRKCSAYGKAHGCEYLFFDRDSDLLADLPVHRW